MNGVIVFGILLVLCFLVCDCDKTFFHSRKNWALNKQTRSNGHILNYDSSLAVDGDRSNDLKHGSCTQTESAESPFWQVHLNKFVLVDTIVIVFRGDCCGKLLNFFMLYVSHYYVGSICRKHYGGLETGEVMVIPCDIPLPGKHVGIQAFYINSYLILCEVEIYGIDIPEVKKIELNWAIGMPAFQSSTNPPVKLNAARNAVDNNYDNNHQHGSCTHTYPGDKRPWWMVNLKEVLVVTLVIIINRGDCCGARFHDIRVDVMDSRNDPHPKVCAKVDLSVGEKWDFTCVRPVTGSWVKVTKEKVLKLYDVLTLCEVLVTGAKPVADPIFNVRGENYAYAKTLVKSDDDINDELKNANDGDIFIYQKKMTCMHVRPVNSAIWIRINLGYMFIEAVIAILHPDCCRGKEHYFLTAWIRDKVQCGNKQKSGKEIFSFACPVNTYGDIAIIQKYPPQGDLHVCELVVHGYNNDQNWAAGRLATIEENLPDGSIKRHKSPSSTDGDISNGYGVGVCPTFFSKHPPARLVVDLREVYISVDKIYFYTPDGPKAHVIIRNPVIHVKQAEEKSVSCNAKSAEFKPGVRAEVLCGGAIANKIILTNGPNEKEFAICNVEVYGKFNKLIPVKSTLWVARLVVSL